MRNFTVPVFGNDGEQVGMMPLGQGPAQILPTLRNPVAEQEALQKKIDEAVRELDPALYDARRRLLRTQQTLAQYETAVSEIRWAVSQKTNEAMGTSPDATIGTREERARELAMMRLQLDELEQETNAAREEVEAAKAIVISLLEESHVRSS